MNNSEVPTVCKFHKKQALFQNDNILKIKNEYPCVQCCKDYIFTNPKHNTLIKKLKKKISMNLKFLNLMEKSIQFYELNILNQIQAIKQEIFIASEIFKEQDKIIRNQNAIQKIGKEQLRYFIFSMKQNIDQALKKLAIASQVDKLEELIKEGTIQQEEVNFKTQKFKTQQVSANRSEMIIQNFTEIQHNSICNAIAFNYKSTELVAGYSNSIYVYKKSITEEFNLIQKLQFHSKNVSYLQFMKNDKSFTSGGQDGKVVIWEFDENNQQYKHVCILNHHSYSVTCIKISQSQNILVSSGVDCTLKFYYHFNSNNWAALNTIETSSFVTDLSFNKSSTQLFCCEINKIILIIEGSTFNWKIKQKINTQCDGIQICSFGKKNFATLHYKTNSLQIYAQECTSSYKKQSEIKLNLEKKPIASFHMSSNSKTQFDSLLFLQCDQTIELISFQESNPSIKFKMQLPDIPHYGRMSEDFQYFAYWVNSENLIKIIELKET